MTDSIYDLGFLIDTKMLVEVDKIHLDPKAAILLKQGKVTDYEAKKIKHSCRKYYVEVCNQIRKRINFQDPTLNALQSIDPKKLSENLIPLIILFPNNEIEELEAE